MPTAFSGKRSASSFSSVTPKGSPLGASSRSNVSSTDQRTPLFQAFQQFAVCSTSVSSPGDIIDGTHFLRFLRLAGLCDGNGFSVVDADLLFNKLKERGERFATWQSFVNFGIPEIAARRKVSRDVIRSHLAEASPFSTHTRHVRLHDDRNCYTGAARNGGPTTVDVDPGSLSAVVDRRVANDIRGALV